VRRPRGQAEDKVPPLLRAVGGDPRVAALLALAIVVILASVFISKLMGPSLGETYTKQVYFAVAVGFWGAVFIARYLTGVDRPGWLWLAPLLVGLIGVLLAAWRPELPAPYRADNSKPAWNLARPLPIEMVSAGLLGILWHFRREPSAGPVGDAQKPAEGRA